ncbi:hypothetical protein TrRE_jg1534 [Triparma retinervis]|uniref:glucan 1,3-beta-glucosidase n=1 Tax=Triparma retinervis TaxID=2557542 RepID=A0A9W7ADZ6_9STRA|nr:hypothetical protein TrRE_jg1534 [Triparma retinervis]
MIRGVNLGGWLVLERYIKPSLFTVPVCFDKDRHDPDVCANDINDPYPEDQWTLTSVFNNKDDAREYLKDHWANFVKEDDIARIKKAGLGHVRIPVGHWIMGDISPDEPYVDGEWGDFVRVARLCRKHGIQVWVDLHTAPGSQNGFDNSGRTRATPTGEGWSGNPENVDRTVKAVREIAEGIKEEGLEDVVTGFGVLNEPFKAQNEAQVKDFDDRAYRAVREVLGGGTTVYIADMFDAGRFNGFWDDEEHENTVLDSHYYHVSVGLKRMIGEWSVSFDTLVCTKLDDVMDSYREGGEVLEFDRKIGEKRKKFLRNFAEAQMVAWESQDTGVSVGWFYWNFKMEGGAFAEWDYLRGVEEGWMPTLRVEEKAKNAFGRCEDIIFRTDDSMDIVHEFPPPDSVAPDWQAVEADDDVVVSHGQSLLPNGTGEQGDGLILGFLSLVVFLLLGLAIVRKFCVRYFGGAGGRGEYQRVGDVGGVGEGL